MFQKINSDKLIIGYSIVVMICSWFLLSGLTPPIEILKYNDSVVIIDFQEIPDCANYSVENGTFTFVGNRPEIKPNYYHPINGRSRWAFIKYTNEIKLLNECTGEITMLEI